MANGKRCIEHDVYKLSNMKKKIAILASGSGTNAENLIEYFKDSKEISIEMILSNKAKAYVLERAKNHNVKSYVFTKNEFNEKDGLVKLFQDNQIDFIVLAGFLLLVPNHIIQYFSNRIINIHPSLLPKYGGKGMYGTNVHQSVIANKESESGITIHLVNERFDEGKILFQAKCNIIPSETAESLASKVHILEYEHFPKVVEKYILNK